MIVAAHNLLPTVTHVILVTII